MAVVMALVKSASAALRRYRRRTEEEEKKQNKQKTARNDGSPTFNAAIHFDPVKRERIAFICVPAPPMVNGQRRMLFNNTFLLLLRLFFTSTRFIFFFNSSLGIAAVEHWLIQFNILHSLNSNGAPHFNRPAKQIPTKGFHRQTSNKPLAFPFNHKINFVKVGSAHL